VPSLQQDVLAFIHKHALLKPGDRVGIAVSGGADSVALLRLLLELRGKLGLVLSVVHFNHKLRSAESDEDERFVAELAREHDLEIITEKGDVRAYSAEERLSVETAARELRYQFFRRLLEEGRFNSIATGHTLDDQAETVLFRISRGAGTRGLAGIYPKLAVNGGRSANRAAIVRPLLSTRRTDLELYLQAVGQPWREDSSNRDLRHVRNRVRHGILPRLERNLNPAIWEALAEAAEIARAEEDYWEKEVAKVIPANAEQIELNLLKNLPLALQRRAVRALAERLPLHLEFRHVEEILNLASGTPDSPKSASLPDGWVAIRNAKQLRFQRDGTPCPDYQCCLPVPGEVVVPQLNSRFEAVVVSATAAKEYNPDHLLDLGQVGKQLYIRNWHAGDRFWPAHSRASKKIKELLQERHITGEERRLWPLAAVGSEVVWLRGFPVATNLRAKDGQDSVMIQETRNLNR